MRGMTAGQTARAFSMNVCKCLQRQTVQEQSQRSHGWKNLARIVLFRGWNSLGRDTTGWLGCLLFSIPCACDPRTQAIFLLWIKFRHVLIEQGSNTKPWLLNSLSFGSSRSRPQDDDLSTKVYLGCADNNGRQTEKKNGRGDVVNKGVLLSQLPHQELRLNPLVLPPRQGGLLSFQKYRDATLASGDLLSCTKWYKGCGGGGHQNPLLYFQPRGWESWLVSCP